MLNRLKTPLAGSSVFKTCCSLHETRPKRLAKNNADSQVPVICGGGREQEDNCGRVPKMSRKTLWGFLYVSAILSHIESKFNVMSTALYGCDRKSDQI
jgi:hypothetical protein